MKKTIGGLLLIVTLCGLTLLVGEGLNALIRWNDLDGSITYKTYRMFKTAGRTAGPDADLLVYQKTVSRPMFDAVLPDLAKAGAGMGNSPFEELEVDAAAINTRDAQGCLVQKPNLDKRLTFLRSPIFNPFEPPMLFYDADAPLSERAQALIRDYGVRLGAINSNAAGERATLPAVTAPDIVLVAGDSVAYGAGVGDDGTIASALQRNDPARRYVNIAVGGADASDVVCDVEAALKRYPGAVREIVYVYCENDFDAAKPFGKPDAVMAWLKDTAARENIATVRVVYAPYFYNVIPHLTRFRNYRGEKHPYHAAEAKALRAAAQGAGFAFTDIADLALAEARDKGTDFAAFALYVDHVHLSPYGAEKLAAALRR